MVPSFSFPSFSFAYFYISVCECVSLGVFLTLSWISLGAKTNQSLCMRTYLSCTCLHNLCSWPFKQMSKDFLDGKPIPVSRSFSLPRKCDLCGHSCALICFLGLLAKIDIQQRSWLCGGSYKKQDGSTPTIFQMDVFLKIITKRKDEGPLCNKLARILWHELWAVPSRYRY